jgi:hypothetical protein
MRKGDFLMNQSAWTPKQIGAIIRRARRPAQKHESPTLQGALNRCEIITAPTK